MLSRIREFFAVTTAEIQRYSHIRRVAGERGGSRIVNHFLLHFVQVQFSEKKETNERRREELYETENRWRKSVW